MPEYSNEMQMIVSRVYSDKDGAPVMRAKFEINGTKYEASLWVWTRKADDSAVLDKQGNKQFKGPVKIDDFVPNTQSAQNRPKAAPVEDEFSDEIPF